MSGRVSVPTMSMEMEQVLKLWRVEETDSEFSIFDFEQIADATDNFSDNHKLGQGGFGPVYKVCRRSTVYILLYCHNCPVLFSSIIIVWGAYMMHTHLLCHVLTLLPVHHYSSG